MPPRYEKKAKERITTCLKSYVDIVARAESEGFNESDTADIVHDILHKGLGYEKFFEITSEFQIKRHYADFAVKLDGKVRYFIEVKAIGSKLSERDLFQIQSYFASHNLVWMLLTNGRIWICYHLSAGSPPTVSKVFEVDLLSAREDPGSVVEHLYLISREAISRECLSDYWEFARATSPETIGSCLLSESVLRSIRKELRNRTSQNVTTAQISEVLMTQVIKGNVSDLIPKRAPRKRAIAPRGKEISLEEHLKFRGALPVTKVLYSLLEEGIMAIDPSVYRKIGGWSVTFYSPAHVFVYVKTQKSAIKIHCYTGNTSIDGVDNPWKRSPKWGRCYLKSKRELDKILAILRESRARLLKSISANENTGWFAKRD